MICSTTHDIECLEAQLHLAMGEAEAVPFPNREDDEAGLELTEKPLTVASLTSMVVCFKEERWSWRLLEPPALPLILEISGEEYRSSGPLGAEDKRAFILPINRRR